MVNLKKAALAVLALGVSAAATAGMYAPPPAPGCQAGDVSVGCEKRGWMIGAEALYVKVGNVGQVTATQSAALVNDVPVYNTDFDGFAPDWNWGFRLQAAYMFGTGNDINVNWTHFVKDSNQTVSNSDAGSQLYGLFISNVLATGEAIDNVETAVDNKFDSINFEFGQTVHFGEKVDTRFHAGLQYANIRQTLSQTGWNGIDADATDYSSTESKFNGIGPRAGLDSSYNFGNGMSVFGNFAGAILVGQLKYSATETFTDADGNATGPSLSSDSSASTSFVPEAEARLGVAYSKPMAQGDLKVEAGYQVAEYWDALSTTTYGETEDSTAFNFQGVFLGLTWTGNV